MSEKEGFFVKYRAKVTGPHTREEISAMVADGRLSPIHRVSTDKEKWRPLHDLDGWKHLSDGQPQREAPNAPPAPAPPSVIPESLRGGRSQPGSDDSRERETPQGGVNA